MKKYIFITLLTSIFPLSVQANIIDTYVDSAIYNLELNYPSLDITNMYTECYVSQDFKEAVCNSKTVIVVNKKVAIRSSISQNCSYMYKEFTNEYLGIQCQVREELPVQTKI